MTLPMTSTLTQSHHRRKSIGLGVAAVLAHVIFWWLYRDVLHAVALRDFSGTAILQTFLTFLFFLLAISFAALVSVLVPDRRLTRAILFLCAVTCLIAFGFTLFAFVTILLLMLALWQYEWSIHGEAQDRVKFSMMRLAQSGIGMTITLFLHAIAVTFNGVLSTTNAGGSSLESFYEAAGSTVNKLLSLEIPQYNPDESLDSFLYTLLANQASNAVHTESKAKGLPISFSVTDTNNLVEGLGGVSFQDLLALLPESVRSSAGDPIALQHAVSQQIDSAFHDAFAGMRNQLIEKLGVDADGTTPVGTVVNEVVKKNLARKVGPYEKFIPPIFAITIFITLQVFAFIYIWLIIFSTSLLFWILKATHVVRLEKRTLEQEYPVFE